MLENYEFVMNKNMLNSTHVLSVKAGSVVFSGNKAVDFSGKKAVVFFWKQDTLLRMPMSNVKDFSLQMYEKKIFPRIWGCHCYGIQYQTFII